MYGVEKCMAYGEMMVRRLTLKYAISNVGMYDILTNQNRPARFLSQLYTNQDSSYKRHYNVSGES